VRAVIFVCLFASLAEARKQPPPKLRKAEAAAQTIATRWTTAMHFGSGTQAATSLTQIPFFSIAATDETTPCAETTAKTAAALGTSLACLHDHVAPKGMPKLWHRTLGGPLAAQMKNIAELAKGSIIFELDEGCDGTSNQTLVFVKGKQVSAVLAQTAACTE